MDLVWSTSDSYAEIAATSIISVLENNKDIDIISIYVIDMGLSEKNKRNIVNMINAYERTIYFLEKFDIEQHIGIEINVGRWHISTFSRLFLLHILPEELEKIIYLDCDMIVLSSLNELWSMDMENSWVMSADDCRGVKYRTNIGIDKDSIYTNNGLMVIDLKAWKDNNVELLFIDFIKKHNGDITYMDQGVLNGVLQPIHKVKLLPISYNAQTACFDLGYDGLQTCRRPVWAYKKDEFEKGIRNPIVVHFTTCFYSGTRPWFQKDSHPYRREFLKYREMTPWRDIPLREDNTKFIKKIMTKICHLMPKKMVFFIICIFHVWLYPAMRDFKKRW